MCRNKLVISVIIVILEIFKFLTISWCCSHFSLLFMEGEVTSSTFSRELWAMYSYGYISRNFWNCHPGIYFENRWCLADLPSKQTIFYGCSCYYCHKLYCHVMSHTVKPVFSSHLWEWPKLTSLSGWLFNTGQFFRHLILRELEMMSA